MDSAPSECTPGVDWITLTTGDDEDADLAYQKARALSVEQVAAGDRLRPWGMRGYEGFATRHLRCGHKDGDVLIELSGHLADAHWQSFAALARTISRLDTKVDVTFPREVRDLGIEAYNAPGVPLGPNLPCIAKALYTGTAGGQTCYVGAMGGRRLGRLYDKSAEDRGDTPPNTWRWELQERTPFSGITAGALRRSDQLPRSIAAYVSAFYTRHGIVPWFEADRIALPGLPGRRPTDLSAFCTWLRTQVAPGVRRWSDRGGRHAILDALALDLGQGQLEPKSPPSSSCEPS